MTLQEFKREAVDRLDGFTEDPAFEADQLIQGVLNINRKDALMKRKNPLSAADLAALREALERRLSHEPLQYICGEWDFFGLRMFCGKGCLIPRPETEMLAELAIKTLPRGGHLLDLCTGSGCLAVAVLNNRPDVTASAVDISEDALCYARKNAAYHGIGEDRLSFCCADLLDYVPLTIPDVIVSNPPYIKSEDVKTLSPEVLHEPLIALDGGHDGLDFYKNIAARYPRYLAQNGSMFLEVGYDIGEEVAAVFRAKKMDASLIADMFGVERVCVVKRR